jgi:membrane-associated protease RseP (regulator of RpoE activity)
VFVPPRRPRSAWREYGIHALLFVLTCASVWRRGGPEFVVAVMSILLAHEMGHYLACRWYRVDATLPFFIPAPYIGPAYTLGAFIRIREPIPHRRALFDIGIAGPLAGFAVCLPVLGMALLEVSVGPSPQGPTLEPPYGMPLLFQWATTLVIGRIPPGQTLYIGPYGLAAWFGLFVTALNMMPVGQLDGGHVMHALVRRHAVVVSRLGLAACLGLLYLRPTWLLWTVLLLALARRPHPPTLDDERPLGAARVLVGIFGFLVFAVCFTPSPIVIGWDDFLAAFGPS